MGAFQLPDSVLGDAIGCLVYSFLCLVANGLLVWLIWTHNERKTYIAFIAYFALIATYSSIIQQLYDYIFWGDLMVEQYYYGKEHADDAEVQYQKGIFGLKLVLSYIRIFAFTVESTLVFFFSFSLTATVYGWWAKKPKALRILSITGRTVPIALAIVMIILLQLDFTHNNFMVYMSVANAQFVISLVGACIFLLMILFKYMQTLRQLKSWSGVQYGKGGSSTATSGLRSFRSRANSNRKRPVNGSFDNWLVIRLSIAFAMLCVFEYTNIGPRLSAKGHVVESAYKPEPDLSHKRALSSVRGYLSGVSPSLLAFVVFGTTKAFQKKMYRTFVPKFLRRGRGDDDDMFTCRHPPQLPSSDYGSSNRASTMVLPPPVTASTHVNSPRGLSHSASSLSMRKHDAVAHLATINDDPDEFAEFDPRFPRRSQIGVALSELPSPPPAPAIDDTYGQSRHDSRPYSPRTPLYSPSFPDHSRHTSLSSPRGPARHESLPRPSNHSRHESVPSPTTVTHSRHHSFSRPTSRSVDRAFPRPPSRSLDHGRGRSRSRSGTGTFLRDASRDSSSSSVPISRYNLAGRVGVPIDVGGDDSGSVAGVSMTTIWSDAPRRGSKHSRI